VSLRDEPLIDGWTWWRIADAAWRDPLDPSFAERAGGRWNPPRRFCTLYLNEDQVTARLNLRHFIARWPYEPEDLRQDTGPVLVGATLPRAQLVCDAHTRAGLLAAGLPSSYPRDRRGSLVSHARCQPIGAAARACGLRGVRARSARATDGAGRELAWFPATARSLAHRGRTLRFEDWYWG
jgi:hypothetical protein